MTVFINQNDFSHGELDPRLITRTDLDFYNRGALKLRNVVVIPQGGAKRRFGTEFIDTISENSDEYMLFSFIFSETVKYLLLFTPAKLTIYRDDVIVHTITTPYTVSQLIGLELKMDQSPNLLIITHPDEKPYKLLKKAPFSDTDWTFDQISFKYLPANDYEKNYDDAKFILDNVKVGDDKTLTTDTVLFTDDFVGGLFNGFGQNLSQQIGVARITSVVSATVAKVTIISEFEDAFKAVIANGVPGKNCFLGEAAWSDFRGWPSTVTFYEGRLYFGGSKSLPGDIFGSTVNDFFNFNIATGRPSDAIQVKLGGSELNTIVNIVGDTSLQIYTTNSERTAPQLEEQPLEPGNISIRRQSNNGSSNVDPVVLDNRTFYVKRGGKGVMSFSYTQDSQAYISKEVSILSAQLVVNPIDSSVLKGSARDEANYMFLVNDDGTLISYQTLTAENISAFTGINTSNGNDLFKRTTSVQNDIYFIVERTIDGNKVQYLEKLNFDRFMDSDIIQTFPVETTIVPNLSHLEGETVKVRGDNFVLSDQVVENGEIIIERPSLIIEVGIGFDPLIRPMPPNVNSSVGNLMYIKKRQVKIYVDFFESVGVLINGIEIPSLSFGNDVLDQPVLPKTDFIEFSNLGDWEIRPTFDITQTEPLPMLILGTGYEVSTGGGS